MDLTNARWRTSSYSSGNGGDCVEIAALPGVFAVRDSKNPSGGALRLSPGEWHGFLAALKQGAFDR